MDMNLWHGDCLELMKDIPSGSVNLVLCDPPYGTTACPWDAIISFERLWAEYKRVLKPYSAVVLFGSQPFTTTMIASNLPWFKYEWVWMKNRPTNFAHAKNKPMKKHENICVFSEGTTVHATQSASRMPYFPQGLIAIHQEHERSERENTDVCFSKRKSHGKFVRENTGYPHSILEFSTEQLGLHPTAKPVLLLEYLIKSYTSEGESVLDNCMGSGSAGIASLNTKRAFIGIEKDDKYFAVAKKRIEDAQNQTALF